MDVKSKRAIVRQIRDGLLVTRIACSRTAKTSHGDIFVSATADLIGESGGSGVPLDRRVKVAVLVLGAEIDQAVHDRTLAAGMTSESERDRANRAALANSSKLIGEALDKLQPGEVSDG